ncbi:MAG: hypothetical protein PHV32_02285 [Eubacteriales bacterium]|nr:hypothetical protein [Eubacteriales bacterium]
MKLIERYLYAFKKYLPEEIREDAAMELRANIEDMLPDNYKEGDVYQVLMKLGSPTKLADEYNSQKRYLIGPAYYEKYISMLKMVIGIFVPVILAITLVAWLIESPGDLHQPENIATLVADLISSAFIGAVQGAFWLTLVFVILERTGVEAGHIPFSNKKWTPDDLPEIPVNNKKKISRGETMFAMFATILFTAVIYFNPQLIALYLKGENDSLVITPLFDIERLQLYIPIFIIFALIQLGIFVWKFIAERWSLPIAIVNAAYNVAVCILVIVMLSDHSLINTEFISALAGIIKTTAANVSKWIIISKQAFGLFFVVVSMVDSALTFAWGIRKSR